ncbi:glycerate kinase [uncultured Eudoraea sp.]|uniref:glycerate kinase n=1 Tax=uncultured Eudoraea sp. TaxID=1035614 RepID=UPI00261C0516|nr:glycerate kinase [uncultured Eudoraea sp.]
MNFLLVPDKFKGSLSAKQVIDAISRSVYVTHPRANIYSVAASDGGEGFLESVRFYMDLESIEINTTDPLGRKIKTEYLLNRQTGEAYIELAKASGLELLKKEERNPLLTSTKGTGIQIKDAVLRGAKKIYIGLGGSATTDAGLGIAAAFDFLLLDELGNSLEPIGKNLSKISTIEPSNFLKAHKNLQIYAVNDVENPLFGPTGAAYVYSAQKGANKEEIIFLDKGLQNLQTIVKRDMGKDYAHLPGCGAAGGAAYGLKTFLNAKFISGTDFLFQLAAIEQLLESNPIDFIITGEGKIDEQTFSGKLIHGILEFGKAHSIPVIAICGTLELDKELCLAKGLHAVLEVRDPSKSLAFNMENAASLIEKSIVQYMKLR